MTLIKIKNNYNKKVKLVLNIKITKILLHLLSINFIKKGKKVIRLKIFINNKTVQKITL